MEKYKKPTSSLVTFTKNEQAAAGRQESPFVLLRRASASPVPTSVRSPQGRRELQPRHRVAAALPTPCPKQPSSPAATVAFPNGMKVLIASDFLGAS